MEYRQLKYFQAVAEKESVVGAAEKLFLTPPALSKSISALEQELGVSLFDRIGKNKIRLNRFGKILLSHTEKGLWEIEEGIAQIQDSDAADDGEIYYAVPSYEVLEGPLERFMERYPHMRIHQYYLSSAQMEEELLKGVLDFSISLRKLPGDRFSWTPLLRGEYMALLSTAHPLAKEKRVSLLSLKDEPFVINNGCSDVRDIYLGLCRQAGFTPTVLFEGDAPHILGRLILQNKAVALVASHAEARVEGRLEPRANYTPDLVSIRLLDPGREYEIGIETVRGRYLSHAASRFVSFLLDEVPRYLASIRHESFLCD